MSVGLSIFHVAQAVIGVYAGADSYTSIFKLLKYEEKSEKAAKYSNTAEHQLHKSRTTQTSGALTTLLSLVSCIVLAAYRPERKWVALTVCTTNMLVDAFAYQHIRNFWRGKMKVPFVKHYSDAITTSNRMNNCIGLLGLTWVFAFVGHLVTNP